MLRLPDLSFISDLSSMYQMIRQRVQTILSSVNFEPMPEFDNALSRICIISFDNVVDAFQNYAILRLHNFCFDLNLLKHVHDSFEYAMVTAVITQDLFFIRLYSHQIYNAAKRLISLAKMSNYLKSRSDVEVMWVYDILLEGIHPKDYFQLVDDIYNMSYWSKNIDSPAFESILDAVEEGRIPGKWLLPILNPDYVTSLPEFR